MPSRDPIPDLKRQIGSELARLLANWSAEGWSADDLAVKVGTERARIWELRHRKLERFSLGTLIRYLERMGCTVELRMQERPRRLGRRVTGDGTHDRPDVPSDP